MNNQTINTEVARLQKMVDRKKEEVKQHEEYIQFLVKQLVIK